MSTTVDAAGLSAQLRAGSAQEHTDAEGSSFVGDLLEGRVSAEGYLAFLQRLAVIYDALESVASELSDDALASAVIDPALDRRSALAEDLAYWSERTGASYDGIDATIAATLAASPAAATYADRIRSAGSWGGLFVAHHYTRYLGDLSGGQVIGRALTRHYDLPEGKGIAFYEFSEIPKAKPYKDRYRDSLDALPVETVDRERMVDEVKAVFGLNKAIFDELGTRYSA